MISKLTYAHFIILNTRHRHTFQDIEEISRTTSHLETDSLSLDSGSTQNTVPNFSYLETEHLIRLFRFRNRTPQLEHVSQGLAV